MLDKTSSIICAFGLASAAPRSPYRHLELCGIALKQICRGRCRALSNISPHHSPQGSGRTLCAPTGGIPSQSPPHHSKPVFSLTITFQGHLACPIFTQKTAPYPIKSGVQHRFFLSYSINSIIMLCAFCACSPIRQALSPAQNRSLPSPQSGQTNRPHKQSAGFSGQAGQCPGALSRSSA